MVKKEEMEMKAIKKFASLLLFAGVLASCQKENIVETAATVSPTTFTASLEPDTRVTIDGFAPKFEVGDVLNVTASNNAAASFNVTEVSSTGVATLEINGTWSADPVAPYYIYNGTPAMIFASNGLVMFNAPTNITNAIAGSISLETLIAKAETLENVTMLNASCLIKITVPETIKNIRVAPLSGNITSQASINFIPEFRVGYSAQAATEVVFSGNNGQSLTAGTYYIPLFPQTFQEGVKVGYSTDGVEYVWRQKDGNFDFQRNKIYDMGSLADWCATSGPSLDDFAGTFLGGIDEKMVYGGNVIVDEDHLTETAEFVFEVSDGNLVMTKFFGKDCSVTGAVDFGSKTVTFSSGNITGVRASNLPIKSSLVLTLSDDNESYAQVGKLTVGTGAPDYDITLSTLKKKAATPDPICDITDVSGFSWVLTYDVDGSSWTDEDTFTFMALTPAQAAAYGANLYGMGAGGQGKTILINLDVYTGEMTIPSARVSGLVFSGIVEYDSKEERLRVPRDLKSDVILQFAADKNSFSAASVELTGNSRYEVGEKTLTNFTFTKKQ